MNKQKNKPTDTKNRLAVIRGEGGCGEGKGMKGSIV